MFSFKIQPIFNTGCYGENAHIKLEVVFGANDTSGAMLGWSHVYLDIFYLDSDGEGLTYLLRNNGTDFMGVELTAGADGTDSYFNRIFYLQEDYDLPASAQYLFFTGNKGRQLYFLLKDGQNVATNRILKSGIIDYDAATFGEVNGVKDQNSWIRNDIENVLFPRTKRLLSYDGENLLLDNFDYDNAGNITSLRARCFDSKANAEAATIDTTDTEIGETANLDVDQTHELPRNLRTSHLSRPTTEADDIDTTANNVTDTTSAPGNSGDWTT